MSKKHLLLGALILAAISIVAIAGVKWAQKREETRQAIAARRELEKQVMAVRRELEDALRTMSATLRDGVNRYELRQQSLALSQCWERTKLRIQMSDQFESEMNRARQRLNALESIWDRARLADKVDLKHPGDRALYETLVAPATYATRQIYGANAVAQTGIMMTRVECDALANRLKDAAF
jgi:hypothetical protein